MSEVKAEDLVGLYLSEGEVRERWKRDRAELATLRAELAAREAADARMVALGFGGIDAALARIDKLEAELREAAETLRDIVFLCDDDQDSRWREAFIAKWGTKP